MTLGGVKFGKEGICAESFQHATGFVDGGVDFAFVCQSRFKSEGIEERVKCLIGEMPAAQGFVDEPANEP